jgi:hypothetical protein
MQSEQSADQHKDLSEHLRQGHALAHLLLRLCVSNSWLPKVQLFQGLNTGTPVTAMSFVFRVTRVRF